MLLGLGALGTGLFVVTFLLDGLTRPGYRPARHPVSALSLGSRGWLQTANFLVSGSLITASAFGVGRATDSLWLACAIAVFGLSLMASGVFPMDPMRGYPPHTPDQTPTRVSRRHQLHDWAGMIVFTSLPCAALVAAIVVDDALWSWYSGLTAVALVALFVLFGRAWGADSERVGLIQRILIIIGWAWLGLLCWHLGG